MQKQTDIEPTELNIKRKTHVIERDISRVICRLLSYGGAPPRIKKIIRRIRSLDSYTVTSLLGRVMRDFSDRHKNLDDILKEHYRQIRSYIPDHISSILTEEEKLLIGSFFTMEYAIESAALFNPSIVPHPNQEPAPEGSLRFIMSLRAVGEGHISSLIFRSGSIDQEGELSLDPASSYVETPAVKNPVYDKKLFRLKLKEMDVYTEITEHVLQQLPAEFNYDNLKKQIRRLSNKPKFVNERQQECFVHMRQLADSNYILDFEPHHNLSERVIFPVTDNTKGGIEDARFVKFEDDRDEAIYYATYTAYNGHAIMPQLIETKDFDEFKISPLYGDAVKDKGMALFPRKIDGDYVMLSRQDGENNHIMFSENLYHWQQSEIIQKPCQPWELIQVGNCGSPIELPEGWLVLTHGVGPMRTYSIGAILLDLEDPTKVIGKLKEPLLQAFKQERVGYVPNVVYTCGAIIHKGRLIIPYSMSDIQPAIASIEVEELLNAMQ